MGTQNKIIIPIFDMIDETYIWSWAEVSGETEEWTIGSIQHTEKEQQRAKEAEETLRTAIKEEQAGTIYTQSNSGSVEKPYFENWPIFKIRI